MFHGLHTFQEKNVALVIVLCMIWLIVGVFCDVALLQRHEAGNMMGMMQLQRVAQLLENSDCDKEEMCRSQSSSEEMMAFSSSTINSLHHLLQYSTHEILFTKCL